MHVLFVHQNFPAQFRYIAPRLISDYGWECSFVTERAEGDLAGVRKILYKPRGGASLSNHVCTRNFENAVAHAHGVYEALKQTPDLRPDLIVAHTGFGSSLFLPFLYDAPIINFLELYYHPSGQDMGFRPELPVREVDLLRIQTKNAMILLDLVNCDRGWTPTFYQRDYFPAEFKRKIEVIFDGIDTQVYRRQPDARGRVAAAQEIPPEHRIVTYVARGFERMRGFDIFMKVAQKICQARSDVSFIVVGTDKVHYGGDMNFTRAPSFRHQVLGEENYDLSRFHFTGYVPQETLADILSASDLHIYLTEPFIASWSMVNAMACGAVLLASDQTCVREYVQPGVNGLLRDFFDVDGLTEQSLKVLANPAEFAPLAEAAIRTVEQKYSLAVAMPRIKSFLESVAAHPRSPSHRNLIHAGTVKHLNDDPDLARSSGSPSAGLIGGPESSPTSPVGTPLAGAIALAPIDDPDPIRAQAIGQIRQLLSTPRTIPNWIAAAASFRGNQPPFESLGLDQHPNDLARLLTRFNEWKPRVVLELGTQSGGTLLLLARIADDRATLIAAAGPDAPFEEQKVPFFKAMAKPGQEFHAITGQPDLQSVFNAVEKILGNRKIDVMFVHGRRPLHQLQWEFRHYRKKVRPGGLIGWDGINPVIDLGPDHDGGHRLWAEVKPNFPQRAEYLDGCHAESGGIAAVKLP